MTGTKKMTTSEQTRIAVIGGGMAGMASAWRLRSLGYTPVVFESNDRVGGRMQSIRKGEFLMDTGMSAYLGTYKEAISLIREVGLADQMSELPAIGGFMREGRRHQIRYTRPLSSALTTGYLSPGEKLKSLRVLLDTYRRRESLGYSDYTSLGDVDIESAEQYCKRTVGASVREYFGRPLISGTWASKDDETSVALLFWTIRNMLAPYVYNLDGGVMQLPEEIANHVEVRYKQGVENVTNHGAYVEVSAGGSSERFDGCVIATTAEAALAIYPQMDEITRRLYASNHYRKLGNVCIGFSHRPTDPSTYYLPSPHEDPDTIAVIADHNKAPYRAPEGKGLLTVLLSHDYLERSEHLSDEQVVDYSVDRAKRYYTDLREDAIEATNVVRWPHSVPNIDVGRFRLIAEYAKKLDRGARVQFASDMDRIPGCNGALVSGEEAARRIADIFSGQQAAKLAKVA